MIGVWDLVLLVAVSLMATAIAYIHNARAKALFLMLPVPFTLANLALASPVDATNVLALPVLYMFAQGVRLLHAKARMNIIAAIVISVAAYCLAGWALAAVVPKTGVAFWIATVLVLSFGIVIHFAFKDVDEPGHRSTLPVWQKLPAVMLVVLFLIAIKSYLHGFMTLFPMVGVIAVYESRYSLATTCRKVGTMMFTILPMIIAMRIAQSCFSAGIGASLAVGWLVFLAFLLPVAIDVRRKITV